MRETVDAMTAVGQILHEGLGERALRKGFAKGLAVGLAPNMWKHTKSINKQSVII